MNNGHLLIAYHGCDAVTRDDLVSGRLKELSPSSNGYDWLGPGVYFFENDPARALLFAHEASQYPDKQFTKRPIATPAVVGAIIRVQSCLDMTTQAGIDEFAETLDYMVTSLVEEGASVPQNSPAGEGDSTVLLRYLDNLTFRFLQTGRGDYKYQLVRGAFHQGDAIAENSGFYRRSHIQIAVCDPTCIVGWFMPPGAELMNSVLYEDAMRRRRLAEDERMECRRNRGRVK